MDAGASPPIFAGMNKAIRQGTPSVEASLKTERLSSFGGRVRGRSCPTKSKEIGQETPSFGASLEKKTLSSFGRGAPSSPKNKVIGGGGGVALRGVPRDGVNLLPPDPRERGDWERDAIP